MSTTYSAGLMTAYGAAKDAGYTGTYAQFCQAMHDLAGIVASATTLPAGSQATATYNGGTLSLGIPRGEKGDRGETGATGPTGATGQTGATGNGIVSVTKTGTSGLVDTYTITFTDGNTTTFTVTNGEDGEVTQAQLDAVIDDVTDLKTAFDRLATTTTETFKSSNLMSEAPSRGYYWRGSYTDSNDYNNTGFIEVEEGETITFQYGNASALRNRRIATMRFVDGYDENKNFIWDACKTTQNSYTVPTGVKYVRIGVASGYLKLDGSNNESVVYGTTIIDYEPYFEPYEVAETRVNENSLPIPSLHVYLPPEICVGIGRTVELYNDLVCLEADKYHLHYTCNAGVQYERKFSITGSTVNNHYLQLQIFDDNMQEVWSGTSIVRVVANSIANEKKIIPIGDSLTNLKSWLSEVQTLSNSKIKYIGTRGRSDSTIRHEGRSGFNALQYNENSEYTFDNNYQGSSSVSGTVNPFYNGSRFSLAYYNTQQSATVGTADAVQLFLGTNDIFGGYTAAESAQHIKALVDGIRADDVNIPIFVCNTIYRSNQNGYYSNGGQGFTQASGWAFDSDMKIMALQTALAEALNGYTNVYIIPLSVCMDRENDFGQVEVAVNPRLATVTESIPNESVHPQEAGYMQIADVMYSAYIAHLS